ncbi:MAG: lipid-A-disaccharide synthase [Bacteroidales bacterium]
MKYYLIAGEASGDLHASNLMRALREKDPNAEFRFFGGDLMQAQGGELVKHYRDMAYMGFVQVVRHLPTIMNNMKTCQQDIRSYQPDVVILVDYPSFNLKIARFVKEKLDIPVHYYISPKIWAWKEYRIKEIKKYVDKMLCILPFEESFYAGHDYAVEYVGNPTVDELTVLLQNKTSDKDFRRKYELSGNGIVAILAGSRRAEVRENLPKMLEALKSFPELQPVIAGAPGLTFEFYREILGDSGVKVIFNATHELLLHADVAVVTSGTATLETAVLGVPQVVCYHVGGGRFFYELMSRVLKVKYVSLVNLIVDDHVVAELLGYKFTPDSLIRELRRITEDGREREKMLEGYRRMMQCLGGIGAAEKAAGAVVKDLVSRDRSC